MPGFQKLAQAEIGEQGFWRTSDHFSTIVNQRHRTLFVLMIITKFTI